ncbi:MAG: sugar phosphate isomerase/epimerase [Clostridiaceae bacterium]|nr:sugar phosphate isomerase/epimerase [Clostridiaceae bacterium]
MKPSVWSSYFIDLSPEDMVMAFSSKGWIYSELSDEHAAVLLKRGKPDIVGKEFKEFAGEHGLSFLQGHLWLGCDITAPNRKEIIDVLKNWFELFNAIGIKYAVLHPGGRHMINEGCQPDEILNVRVDSLSRLIEYIKDTDMYICLENIDGTAPCYDELSRIINAVGTSKLGICLDTGHANISGIDQVEFIRKAGTQIKALHIADNEGTSDQHMMPYERGNIQWDRIVPALKEINYSGLFNLEIPGENRCPLEIRLAKLDYIKYMICFMLEDLK